MNILPKKNWHVRNKDNVAKVKRDEAKAADEEKERQKRLEIAESEARLNILRSKHTQKAPIEFVNSEHINLFEREEKGQFNEEKNPETELEKKQEKEAFEKKIGLLNYLNKDQIDFKSQPWNITLKHKKSDDINGEKDLKRKLEIDPLNLMKTYTKEDDKSKKSKSSSSSASKHEKSSSKAVSTPNLPVKKTIEQLRAERIKRENEERLKVNQLLNPSSSKPASTVELDDRKRKYNSQFNPHLSRQ